MTASAELYRADTGTWSAVAAMPRPRAFHTATLLPDGSVLVVGGMLDNTGNSSPTADLRDERFARERDAAHPERGRGGFRSAVPRIPCAHF